MKPRCKPDFLHLLNWFSRTSSHLRATLRTVSWHARTLGSVERASSGTAANKSLRRSAFASTVIAPWAFRLGGPNDGGAPPPAASAWRRAVVTALWTFGDVVTHWTTVCVP